MRTRHDGWTADRQAAFVEALAQSGCVTEACGSVGLSKASAYALRMRPDAQGFRIAWDAALHYAVRRLSDECLARAMHGEVVPHYYQGELVGEHRRFDNKLAMFLMRYLDPLRYAATLDQMVYQGHPEQAAIALMKALNRVMDEANDAAPLDESQLPDEPDEREEDEDGEPVPPPGGPPWRAEPAFAVAAREQDAALAASGAPIRSSPERRARLGALARDAWAEQRAKHEADLARVRARTDEWIAKATAEKAATGASAADERGGGLSETVRADGEAATPALSSASSTSALPAAPPKSPRRQSVRVPDG